MIKYFVIFLVLIGFVGTAFAIEDEIVFEKSDWGAGLSKKECQDRIDLMPTYFEPLLNLAKLKAENHPVFKKITQNKMYDLVTTGVTAIEDSKNCDSPIPSFELHYATDISENSYTRIYVSIDFVSYDVLKIMIRHIDDKFYPILEPSQPLPFYIKDWDEMQIVGKYVGSDPPVPDQTFKLPYVVIGGKIKDIKSVVGGIRVELTAREDASGKFAFKVPRNYPYTDHNDEQSGHPGHGLEVFPIFEITEESYPHVTKSDCFYDVWIPFSGNATMEFGFQISYLIGGWSFHGDNDLPKYCLYKTIVDDNLEREAAKSPLKQFSTGAADTAYDVICQDGFKLVVKRNCNPACVTEKTSVKMWDRNLLQRSTGIYTEYSSKEINDRFQERLIKKEQALKTVEDFVKEKNLVLRQGINQDTLQVDTDLSYALLSKGYPSLLDINEETGLPTDIMPPWWDSFYTTPQWYAELQKGYLEFDNKRIEDGHVLWTVSYRTCQNCIADYPSFYVDAITNKVVQESNVELYFEPSYELENEI